MRKLGECRFRLTILDSERLLMSSACNYVPPTTCLRRSMSYYYLFECVYNLKG